VIDEMSDAWIENAGFEAATAGFASLPFFQSK
jgi:hypothetical protein